MSELRPLCHLNVAMKMYPDAPRLIDQYRAARGNDLPKWPGWCFLPMAAWYAIVCADARVGVLPPSLAGDVGRIAAIMTWRYSQGIYRLDASMLAALADSEMNGDIPSEVLYRLPEWCVYIETPGLNWFGSTLNGFWTHLEWDTKTSRTELRLLLDCESGLHPIPLHVGALSVSEAIERAVNEAVMQADQADIHIPFNFASFQPASGQLQQLISVILYLCSEEPEIDDDREPGTSPQNPRPKKTKRGWRLFPAERPRIWSVGRETGERLRAAGQGEATGTKVKPHLRRAHWHGYWTGKREAEQKFIYKWIAPVVIGGGQ